MTQPRSPRTARRSRAAPPPPLFSRYRPFPGVHDEVFRDDGTPRPGLAGIVRFLNDLPASEFKVRQQLAEAAFLRGGITFSVYSDRRGVEKLFPFDLIPRVVPASEWSRLERGLAQRVRALDLFLADVYGPGRILAGGIVPRELVEGSKGYQPLARGLVPAGGVRVHVAGIDLIRGPDGDFVVLEDNIRTPSGVSYVLENRQVMKRVFPKLFARVRVRSVDEYPTRLLAALAELSPPHGRRDPRIVVLSPGPYNSAYFEHAFLARHMGCELVQGSDLFVHQDRVYVKTTMGPQRVDVIYRRVDDEFLDPTVFLKDSLLGVPGLFSAYAQGHVTLANAVGNGVADDKGIYPFVPAIIRYYLDEDPLIAQVPTYVCARPGELTHVLAHLDRMVVKAVDASGGYGMLIGHQATRAQLDEFRRRLRSDPRGYIAQPLIELSTCPTWTGRGIAPRRVDLRPYVVTGKATWCLPGGLSRVALVEGSYVVNSSQGGGSKDTWVLEGAGR